MEAHSEAFAARPDASTKLALDRTRLAYERTMLAWIRTSTALITFGFGIAQFRRVVQQGVPQADRFIGPDEFGLVMILIGLAALVLATLEHRSAMRDLKVRYPVDAGFSELPRSRARLLAALIALLGLLALFVMLFRV